MKTIRKTKTIALSALLLLPLLPGSLLAAQEGQDPWPDVILLPPSFDGYGLAIGRGSTFYVGNKGWATSGANAYTAAPPYSPFAGYILEGDLSTGNYHLFVGANGLPANGMQFDHRTGYLWVAAGTTGEELVYDTATGKLVMTYQLSPLVGGGHGVGEADFINDTVITPDAVYATDTAQGMLFEMPLKPGGQPEGTFQAIPIDYNPSNPKSHGITATADGSYLIVVAVGGPYLVKTSDLSLTPVPFVAIAGAIRADGDLLVGHTLYGTGGPVGQAGVAVATLSDDYLSAVTSGYLTVDNQQLADITLLFMPNIAKYGNSIYGINGYQPVAPGTPTTASTGLAAVVKLTVQTPIAYSQAVTTPENTPINITLTGADFDIHPSRLTFTVTAQPSDGSLSGSAPNLTYTPNTGYTGSDSFTFTVSYDGETSPAGTVSITVSP